ncbi:putative DNA mismatch endonuclease [Janibacter sp. HTCC2649]|nr:very short patch repair endonuclease [Janibacter sp. HTCC2649]EAP98556.1 putative DNA mismatch endonuclease [Janibacter sp. HTCC2649]
MEPSRVPPSARLSARFSSQARDATKPELSLRRELHRHGLRFRVQYLIPGLPRRRADLAFTRQKVAVFVDGCFWHACPLHCVVPKANREWWLWKFSTNSSRDADTNIKLAELGWTVVRIWEHEPLEHAVCKVTEALRDYGS